MSPWSSARIVDLIHDNWEAWRVEGASESDAAVCARRAQAGGAVRRVGCPDTPERPEPPRRVEPVGDAIDELIERITVDAYGECEQLWSFCQVFEDEVRFPCSWPGRRDRRADHGRRLRG